MISKIDYFFLQVFISMHVGIGDFSATESPSNLFLGVILFAFQIYGDFSGYSDIALGVSRLFGIELLKNFAFPYFSGDIAEFWRRWHISLSSWFRDYVYIPLGDSRGSQAVVSEVLSKKLSTEFDNFSLNIAQSPYGKYYLKALKRKIDPNTKNGIFILTVDPFNLSLYKNVIKENEFPEEQSPFKDMLFYNTSPNYEYLVKHYKRSWFKIYSERAEIGRSNTFLHNDGWLEVNVNMQKDSVQVREDAKVIFYEKFAQNSRLSKDRMKAFNDIISFLKDKGTIYIVRIPASKRIVEIENKNFPKFNDLMKNVASTHKLRYFDFTPNCLDYTYTDGNHMYKESGKIFSAQIADSIAAYQKKLN